ncbi:glycosyltransferase [Lentzea sp. HUAS12]|uniref:glycosyltransferase n=1 Tax=Lentzea sp. HUAS12 TaxID=2951806 RepID=UPI00209EF242|nr:glycosyltransferase [Lentzea sp. HUAS12]USX53785.1 glycosyltransferase [Lentzea sp. HUAS12]
MEQDRLRIAMVSAEQSCFGQNVHVSGLSAALAGGGHAVTVYTRREGTFRTGHGRTESGHDVVRVSTGTAVGGDENTMISQLGRLADFLGRCWRDDPPDVVHAHGWASGLAGVLAARHGIPVVQTYYGLGGSAGRSRGERIVGREVARVIAMSFGEVLGLARTGVGRNRISVVPTGVDVQLFTPWGLGAKRGTRRRIVAVRTVAPDSGLADLVRVLSHVDNAELLIVGGADRRRIRREPEVRWLRAFAARTGVADRVVFTGGVSSERMVALLRSADVVVCAPPHESVGHVPLEAMACGVPVVATTVGALADSVVDGVTGVHVPPGRPRQLAKVLRGLLDDGVRREQFGVAGRDRASARYSWERIAADTVEVYHDAVADFRSRAAGRSELWPAAVVSSSTGGDVASSHSRGTAGSGNG